MKKSRSTLSRPVTAVAFAILATLGSTVARADGGIADLFGDTLPNNFPFLNSAGTAATFSTAGFVDLTNPFHVPQGTNGRSCESCHLPQVGWSIRPIDVELKFFLTQGNDPIFNTLDANSPSPDVSSLQAKRASYSMLRKGLFRRGGNVPANAEYDIVAFDDPLGAGGSLTHFEAFRRPLATANFHIAKNIGWHDQNTNGNGDVHAGLIAQASGNITGAQQGAAPTPETLESIVTYELGLAFAQQLSFNAGLLTACGAKVDPRTSRRSSPCRVASTCSMPGKTSGPARAGSRRSTASARRSHVARRSSTRPTRRPIAAVMAVTALPTTAAT